MDLAALWVNIDSACHITYAPLSSPAGIACEARGARSRGPRRLPRARAEKFLLEFWISPPRSTTWVPLTSDRSHRERSSPGMTAVFGRNACLKSAKFGCGTGEIAREKPLQHWCKFVTVIKKTL